MSETKKMRVGILETGRPPEELGGEFGDYPDMVRDWLRPLDAEFDKYAVLDGQLPEDPRSRDLWVITGSRFAAYEDHPWIPPLELFIRSVRDARRKMIGICFGHQIIAQALGGEVHKSRWGWALGVQKYRIVDWPQQLGAAPDNLALQSYHQDRIEAVPEGAHRIAETEHCPNAALWYPGFALTVQGHPEFTATYVDALLDLRRGTALSEDDVAGGKKALGRQTTAEWLARLVRERFDDI